MNRKIIVAVCCGVLGAVLALWLWSQPAVVRVPQAETKGIQTGLGLVLAEETAKVVPAHGRVVVITTFTPTQLKARSNYLWNTFASELEKRSLSITTTESVLNSAWNSGSLTADQAAFKELLERHATADALVFFVDLPDWGQIVAALPAQYSGPKIIAMDSVRQQMKPRYGGYFTSGMVAALIGALPQARSQSQPKTPREWFDKYYQVYMVQNYESLTE